MWPAADLAPWRNLRLAFLALLGSIALFALGELLALQGALSGNLVLMGLWDVPVPLIASLLCWQASRRAATEQERWSWRLFTFGLATSAFAEAFWIQHLLSAGQPPQSPSLADAAWALFYPAAFVGLTLQIPRTRSLTRDIGTTVDSLLLTLTFIGLSWKLLISPMLAASPDLPSAAVNVAWPLGDLLLLSGVLSLALRSDRNPLPRHTYFVLAAFAVNLIADTAYCVMAARGVYQSGDAIDPLWSLAYALIGVAALASLEERRGQTLREPDWHQAICRPLCRLRLSLPYISLPAAIGLLYVEHNSISLKSERDVVVTLIAVLIFSLLSFRQCLNLSALSRKTRQLSALNLFATRLSQCQSSSEVLALGLEFAREAARAPDGAIWLLKPNGEIEAAIQQGDVSQVSPASPLFKAALATSATILQPVPAQPPAADGRVRIGQRFALVIPLVSRGAALGAMALLGQRGKTCGEDDLAQVQAIGVSLAVALENAHRFEEAMYMADREPVTGLLNLRALHRHLDQEFERAEATGGRFALALLDLDGFKLFNQTYGHAVGDLVLQRVARVLSECAGGAAILGRYGGDEFMAILPEADSEAAVRVAEASHQALARQPILTPDGSAVPIHASFGIAAYPDDARRRNELLSFADANLYESKRRGGNTITTGTAPSQSDAAHVGQFSVLDGLITAVDNKDHYTRQHSEDVAGYALSLAGALGLSESTQRTLRIAALLHDVGKIGVPDHILRKPGRLDEEEMEAVRQHAILGEMIIKNVPNVSDVLAAVGAHHERFDGHGYPRGLAGFQIPLLGRILAVADAYSAMTTDRPYRKGLNPEQAIAELKRVAGTQLDPELVQKFLSVHCALPVPALPMLNQRSSFLLVPSNSSSVKSWEHQRVAIRG